MGFLNHQPYVRFGEEFFATEFEALEGRARVLEGNAVQPPQRARAVLQVPYFGAVMGGMAELFARFYPLKYTLCSVKSIIIII